MRRRLFLWELAGFLWTCAAGTLLHFLYDWSGGNVIAAAFSGVNESTWEHMKLLFFPILLFSVVQVCVMGRNYPNLLAVRALSVLAGLVLIPVLFYTYNGALGKSPDWINIAIFYISAALAFLLEWRAFQKKSKPCKYSTFAFASLLLIGMMFVVFTFTPPRIPLLQDPLTGNYGIERK